MKITKITITNFGPFYGTISFEPNNGLTIIVGRNGVGKTSIVLALKWLMCELYPQEERGNINFKRSNELEIGQFDSVKVKIDYSAKEDCVFEKTMPFSKDESGKIITGKTSTTFSCLDGQYYVDSEATDHFYHDFSRDTSTVLFSLNRDVYFHIITQQLMSKKRDFDNYIYCIERLSNHAEHVLIKGLDSHSQQLVRENKKRLDLLSTEINFLSRDLDSLRSMQAHLLSCTEEKILLDDDIDEDSRTNTIINEIKSKILETSKKLSKCQDEILSLQPHPQYIFSISQDKKQMEIVHLFNLLKDAFLSAQRKSLSEFLLKVESKANEYFQLFLHDNQDLRISLSLSSSSDVNITIEAEGKTICHPNSSVQEFSKFSIVLGYFSFMEEQQAVPFPIVLEFPPLSLICDKEIYPVLQRFSDECKKQVISIIYEEHLESFIKANNNNFADYRLSFSPERDVSNWSTCYSIIEKLK